MPTAIATSTVTAFESDLGWFALSVGRLDTRPVLRALVFGDARQVSALRRLDALCRIEDPMGPAPTAVKQWMDLFQRYAGGEVVSLSSIPVADDHLTPFGRRVAQACRAIPYGQTCSYGQLARRAGRDRAARAVGTVMSQNRTPLVIPCHRVLGAGGKLGGFSAPEGVKMKQRLLDLERDSTASPL